MNLIDRAARLSKFRYEMYHDLVLAQPSDGEWWKLADTAIAHYLNMVETKPIYRICINDDTTVNVNCYDMLENFAPELDSYYSSTDDLPRWAQDKLAVLFLLDHKVINKEVEGVGKRINEHTFWLYKEGDYGDDARG